MAIAHTRNYAGVRHDLVQHLRDTARLAEEFAAPFGGDEVARMAGLLHDIGKFNPAFQSYLFAREQGLQISGPDHKAAGAKLAKRVFYPLALLVQGHHGGLTSKVACKTWLDTTGEDAAVDAAIAEAQRLAPDLEHITPPSLPPWLGSAPLSAELFYRMVYSCLVDADYLDTERHFRESRSKERRSAAVTMADLWQMFERNQGAKSGKLTDKVNSVRHEVYLACLASATGEQGIYRLTVPTGGGKTRSALGFALRHAMKHDLQRIIVAVPFTTVTEQTADEYRAIFGNGDGIVLEHHSGMDYPGKGDKSQWAALAAENWDASLVVTTTVQLFDSLFANSPSRCRKLHRLAKSVIIIDEAQSLPPGMLRPILSAIEELTRNYRTTIVLATATQPSFEVIAGFDELAAHEIVANYRDHFRRLKRVEYDWQADQKITWPEVARRMREHRQALVIVNTKRQAANLYLELAGADTYHLSAMMCPAHRRKVIAEVQSRLGAKEPCYLVATPVVEAGVELDFPFGMRALARVDSIVQAAGRVNRSGGLSGATVVVFDPAEGGMPEGSPLLGRQITESLHRLGQFDRQHPFDPNDLDVCRRFFAQLYRLTSTDSGDVQTYRTTLNYAEVASRFHMIEEENVSVVVEYGDEGERETVRKLIQRLADAAQPDRGLVRDLQPYTVSIPLKQAEPLGGGKIKPLLPGIGVWQGRYDKHLGLILERE